MSDRIQGLEGAIEAVRERIAGACRRAGRDPRQVRLVAVVKEVEPEDVAAATDAGLREFGENYVQQMEAKRAAAPDATWHFIGRLQSNKVRRVLDGSDVVQTLEPGRAAERLGALAAEGNRPMPCLVEVDFTGHRVGISPDEVPAFVEEVHGSDGLAVRGLMTIAPLHRDPRPTFAGLRELRDALERRFEEVRELSMGMSADLEAAVEEGATMVRVGTAIFGPRH
ncbi:MAG: YggS family pyridoxal phosphate-dependent enzyme [Actinomycetota bacterium]